MNKKWGGCLFRNEVEIFSLTYGIPTVFIYHNLVFCSMLFGGILSLSRLNAKVVNTQEVLKQTTFLSWEELHNTFANIEL